MNQNESKYDMLMIVYSMYVYSNSIDSSYLNVKQRIKQMNQNLTEDR